MMSWLLQDAVVATVIALALLPFLRMWRISPGLEHVLWVLIAVKFVLPPIAALSLPASEGVVESVRSTAVGVVVPVAEERVDGSAVASTAAIGYGSAGEPPPTQPVRGRFEWRWLLALWPIGALLALVVRLRAWVRWRRSRRLHAPMPELSEAVVAVARRLGMRAPRVHLESTIRTPLVTGLFRPRLLWPSGLVRSAGEWRMRTVIAHELAHIRRGDLWVAVLELVVGCVWWWYPGWSLVRDRLRDASERACDAMVVAAYPAHRRVYADALLDIAGSDARGPIPALGLGAHTSVRRRLQAILGRTASRSRLAPVAIVLVALSLLPAWRMSVRAQDDVVAVLARAVSDPDTDVRRSVANALRDVGGSAAAAALRELVDDPDANVRHAARSALGLEPARPNLLFPEGDPPLPAPGEIDSLGAMLTRGAALERIAAARRFGNLRDARGVPALVRALDEVDYRVRQAAADALGNIGDTSAATAVATLLDDPQPGVRQSAAGALGSIGAGAQVDALASALRDEDPHVRRIAAEALGRIGTRMRP